MFNFLRISRPIDSIYSETIFTILGFKINNSTIFTIFIIFLFVLLCFFVIKNFKLKPNKTQVSIEIIYELIENLILQITGSKSQTKLILPFIGSLFLFILASNLLGNVPGLTNITFDGKAILRVPTADFSTTFSLAIVFIIAIQLISIKDFGVFGYIGKFIKIKELYNGFRKSFKDGLFSIIDFFIGFMDIISELAKVISLSLRLFGNIYAGIVLTSVIFTGMAYILPSVWVGMGLLFAIVQAVVFSSLITAYYVLAVKLKSEDDV
ncbi:MAG: hypothetical protein A2904_00730 [Candidatus Staskawiczbacteria bacterium RIFCSPLOWO2_01_FULL_33_9]|uniref:ATP synthase subunit a n=1 Tax=Candidatus Staskawiczbacteria bacterium RIFCSPLOWO2_01_FULL_33_9 TaxID=1802211 RepID=A0A1G2I619_9BACT|nr:MAG: hypothetical protein A2904_00730 [Candidatus Staskawiczbacteria bacterium RIFCSPLOWO2_01_FULL_33_9]